MAVTPPDGAGEAAGRTARRALQCTVLFFNAAMAHEIGSQFVRAWAAARAGMPNTLYHYFILYDADVPTPDPTAVVVSTFAPIAWSALLAVASAWIYTHARSGAVRVFTIFLGAFGALGVISPLAFVAWSGPLHEVAAWMELPAALTIGVSVTSALVLVVLMWEAGRRLQPPVSTVIVPVLAGTLARGAVIAPAPAGLYLTLVLGSVYWVVAIAGGLWERRRASRSGAAPPARVGLALSAMTLPVLLALVIRWMALGVRFGG